MGMGKAGSAVIGLVVGLVGGVLGGTVLGGGAMAGVGAATGISTGICSTVRAAQDLDLLTPEQVDAVLAKTVSDAGGKLQEDDALVGSAQACDDFLAKAG